MRRKIILLIGLLFLLCGCTANVDLVVKENGIEESVSITALQDNYLTKEQIKGAFREYIPAFADTEIVDTMPDEKESGVSYYTKSTTELSSGYLFNYKYNFSLGDYVKAKTVKKSFSSASVIKDNSEKTITISTDSAGILLFKEYPNLTEIKVNIKAEYPIKENNADSVNGNVYTWVFTPETKKSIYILYDLNSNSNPTSPSNPNSPSNPDPSNPSPSEPEEETSSTEKKEDNKSAVNKAANKNPILVAILALGLFFIFVIFISKLNKR